MSKIINPSKCVIADSFLFINDKAYALSHITMIDLVNDVHSYSSALGALRDTFVAKDSIEAERGKSSKRFEIRGSMVVKELISHKINIYFGSHPVEVYFSSEEDANKFRNALINNIQSRFNK